MPVAEKGMKNGPHLEQKYPVVFLKIVTNVTGRSVYIVFFEKTNFHIL